MEGLECLDRSGNCCDKVCEPVKDCGNKISDKGMDEPVSESGVQRKPSRLKREPEEEKVGKLWKSTQVLQLNRPIKWRCSPKVEEVKKPRIQSLGQPLGVSFGTYTLKSHPEVHPTKENEVLQAFATNLMAFGEIYITPETEWDNLVMNRILVEGKQHLDQSIRLRIPENEEGKEQETSIPITEKDIAKTFVICGNSMEIDLYDPFIVGTLVSENPDVPGFYYGIMKFMRKLPYCLLTVANQYFLIWKSSGLYFVFDCYGRDHKLKRDTETGFATLLGLCSLKGVNHLILNLSDLPRNEVYVLRKLKMIYLYPGCIFQNQIERRIRQREFEVLNDHHAILKGHLHIAVSCFKENRNKFSLAIAITAMIYSKIDAPSTWDSHNIDKTIVMANEYYNQWTKCNHHIDLVINDIPAKIDIGIYTATISAKPIEACGTWKCMNNFKRNSLTFAIKKVFAKSSNLIVQVADRSYALWRRGDYYYLFDPYKHECRNSKIPVPSAYLHMCSNVSFLCCIFANQIVDLTSPSPFYIHSLKIIDIREKDKYVLHEKDVPTCKCIFKEPDLEDVEIDSLNTSIGDIRCEKALECVADKYGFEADMANLDSPGLSQTQISPAYDDTKSDAGDAEDIEEEEEEDEDEDEDEETESEEGDSDDEGGKGKKKKKGGKAKKGKKGKKERSEKDKKDKKEKGKKEKEKKEKGEKGKEGKEKGGKEKKGKEKGGKDKEGKDKEGKEKEKKEKKEKEKKEKGKKEKKEKEKKDKKGKDKGEGDAGKDKKGKGKDEDEDTDDDKAKGKDRGKDKDKDKDKMKDKAADKDRDRDRDRDIDKRKGEGIYGEGPVLSGASLEGLTESEIEEEEELPSGCLPNSYPGYTCVAHNLAVVGSESGSYESLCNLIKTGFKCSDRMLVMTPWGNYVVFKSQASYLLYDGCTCNVNRFRHLDLKVGTAGLLCFTNMHELINHIVRGRGNKTDRDIKCERKYLDRVISDICEKYGK